MKETGILFTPENIRAIRDGRKTQTRRVCDAYGEHLHFGKKLNEWDLSSGPYQLEEEHFPVWHWRGNTPAVIGQWAQDLQTDVDDNCTLPIRNPYGQSGDRLYVKEGIIVDSRTGELEGYYLDGCRPTTRPYLKRLTAMFMAKKYARTWLELTDVRVERLQDISEDDSKAEGAEWIGPEIMYPDEPLAEYPYRRGYQKLWDSINKVKHPWSSNPFVWVLEFRVI
jgi:hypothetical protein